MNHLLLELLLRLEAIGQEHEEIYDSEVRDQMREAVHDGFLDLVPDYRLPDTFGLASDEGNRSVRDALSSYIEAAKAKAQELGLTFKQRLNAFQGTEAMTPAGTTSDEFFGYSSPDLFTEAGDWLGGEESE
jgi:hypothetical protein